MVLTENPKPNKTGNEQNKNDDANKEVTNNIAAKTFTFRELATATKNFRQECLIGEGGFGRVYKGHIETSERVYILPLLITTYSFISLFLNLILACII